MHLTALEKELHQPKCRSNTTRLCELLHDSFVEFGRGGEVYARQSVIDALSKESDNLIIWSQNYSLHFSTENAALVLYQSAHENIDGSLHRFSNRSSHWIVENGRWQMCFHQGTPTSEFSRSPV